MNICFITSDFPDALKGGVERVVHNLSHIFATNGHKVITLSKEAPYSNEYVKNQNYSLKNNTEVLNPNNITFAINLIKQFSIDVIIYASHHHDMFELALEIKRQTNCKLISTYYNCPNALLKGITDEFAKIKFSNTSRISKIKQYAFLKLGYPIKLKKRKIYLQHKFSYQYANSDAFVVESTRYAKILTKLIGKECPNIYGIPNPISKFNNNTTIKREKNVLYIARMNIEQKRPDRMLRIWKKVQQHFPDWNLLMIGDGPNKQDMIKYAKELSLTNIKFIGNSELLPYYQSSEILCMTSTYEGFGLVRTESFQNEVIPIAFKSYEAIQDIILDKITGILIRPFDENLYAKQLGILMSNKNIRNKYRANIKNCDLEAHFGDSIIYKKWQHILNTI